MTSIVNKVNVVDMVVSISSVERQIIIITIVIVFMTYKSFNFNAYVGIIIAGVRTFSWPSVSRRPVHNYCQSYE